MIISDLEHFEVVSEETSVSGAFAIAQATATAAAFGFRNATSLTATSTLAFFDPGTSSFTSSSTSDAAAAADIPDV